MKLKVADIIVKFWTEHGIKDVFMVTGGGAMHLDDALGHCKDINCIFNHHEQACTMAADGYTRLSGKLAGVCVTSGPGGTNAITGVLGAWLDSIPMFVVSGQVKRSTTVWSTDLPLRQLGDQEFNIVSAVKTMTKYAVMITEPEDILYCLGKAMFLCKNGRPGPVWIDVPLDVQASVVETDTLRLYDPGENADENPSAASDERLNDIIAKIKNAKRPVVFAGSGIRLSKGYNEFIELIEKLNIPVVTAWNAHDSLWNDHRLYCGRPGSIGTRGGNFVVQNSDLLLVLGCRLNVRQISYSWEDFARFAYKIMVDIDEAELYKPTLKIDMPVHADVKNVMQGLNRLLPAPLHDEEHQRWLKWCRDVDGKYPAVLDEYYAKKSPVNPYVFMDKLFHKLPENQTVITSNGSACVISFQAANIKKGQRLFTNSGSASMGFGLPAAIGGAVFENGEPVICLEGDGSIQMNLQELQTVVHNKLNIKIFWLNNDGYHSMRQTQSNLFKGELVGVSEESGISFPSAEKIAAAYGIPFIQIDNTEDADEKIEKALNTEGPVIIEAVLDSGQFFEPKLSSKVMEDGSIVSPPIQDMYPFLDRSEYNESMLIEYK